MCFSYLLFLTITAVVHSALSCNRPAVSQVTEPIDHGECPTWDLRTQLLYFVDVYDGRVLSYNPITCQLYAVQLNGTVAPIIPTQANRHLFIAGVNRSLVAIEWDGKETVGATKTLTTVSPQFPTSRLNDGKADRTGRLWAGTIGTESPTGIAPDEGVLYLFTKENLEDPLTVLQPVNISNGMAWNRANNKFYYIDTFTFTVREFDYDNRNGKISNPRVVFDSTQHSNIGGFPDGMTIDKDDNLWIAMNFGGAVIKVNPKTGSILQIIAIPARDVTSLSWGGLFLDTLYVTTSRHSLTPEERLQQPAAGSLFAVTNLGTRGLPAFATNIIAKIN